MVFVYVCIWNTIRTGNETKLHEIKSEKRKENEAR